MPAWEIPLRVDEHGNGLPGINRGPTDTYQEIHKRSRKGNMEQPAPNHPTEYPVTKTGPSIPTKHQSPMDPYFGKNSHNPVNPSGSTPKAGPEGHQMDAEYALASPMTLDQYTGDAETDELLKQLHQYDIAMGVRTACVPPTVGWEPLTTSTFDGPHLLAELISALAEAPEPSPGGDITMDHPPKNGGTQQNRTSQHPLTPERENNPQ